MQKKIFNVLAVILMLSWTTISAQCALNVTASSTTITCGGSTVLTAQPTVNSTITFQDNFNNSAATGWANTTNAQFNNPCGPSPDATPYIHMGAGAMGGAPRQIATNPLNITCQGQICFDLRMPNTINSPCEDADEITEGVYLQYSLDGTTWVTISYYDPTMPIYDNWSNICVAIPAGAISPATQIRWVQTSYTGDVYDHWSIDNVVINGSCPPGFSQSWAWSNGGNIASITVNPSATTTYSVTYSDGTNTCTGSVTVNVIGPTANAGPDKQICLGQNTTLNGSGATNQSATTVFTNSNTLAINDNSTVTSSLTVSGLPFTTISTTSINRVCIDSLVHTWDSDVDITLTCPGGTVLELSTDNGGSGDNYIRTCFTPSATNIIGAAGNNTAPLTGTFAPEGAGGLGAFVGCTANGNWVLSVGDDLAGDVGTLYKWSITFNTPSTPVISWSPSTGLSSTTVFTPTATPTVTTTYTLSVSSGAGCTAIDSVTVNVGQLTGVNAGANDTICAGTSTSLLAAGGTQYAWSPASGLSASNIANPVASPAVSTTYTVTITDAGCSAIDSVRIHVYSAPPVDAGAGATICQGNSVTLNATGAISYVWSPASGLSSTTISNPIATPMDTTKYFVTGTDANNCTATDSVKVIVNTTPNAQAGRDTSFCVGSSVTLNASGGGTYSWLPATGLSNSSIANPVANPASTTIYTLTVTAPNGCIDKDTITVVRNTLPVITVTPANQAICPGNSAQLSAGGGISYSWLPSGTLSNPSISNPVATPSGTTTYTVTGVGANGCSNTKATTVIVNPTFTVTASADDTICAGQNITISASSTTAGIYSWSPANGLTTPNSASTLASPATSMVYTVTLTNSQGCKAKDSVSVHVNQLPLAMAGTDTGFCVGDSVMLNASGGGTYSWSPSIGLNSTTSATPYAMPTSDVTYTLTVTDAQGCSAIDSVRVSVHSLPTVDAGNYALVCYNSSYQLGASGASSYVWSPAASLNAANISNPVATLTSFTTFTVTGTDVNGCVASDTVSIDVRNPVLVDAGLNDTICEGSSAQLTATAGGINYIWSPSSGLTNSSIYNPIASPLNTTTYTVVLTDMNNCSGIDSVTIKVNQAPIVNAGNDVSICNGSSITLNASGTGAFQWAPSNGLNNPGISNPIASPSTPVTYTVSLTDAAGCIGYDTINVNVNSLPVVDAGNDTVVCFNSATQLNVVGTATAFSWSPVAGLSSSTIANPLATLTDTVKYYVTGTDANMCSNVDSITVLVRPAVVVDAGSASTVCAGDSVQLSSTPGANAYSWSPSSGLSNATVSNPVATPSQTTTYTLSVNDANNCSGLDSVTVTVNQLPNADAGPDKVLCTGSSATLNASGGASYSWSPATGLSNPLVSNPTVSVSSPASYTVTVTDANGCSRQDSVKVTVGSNPLIGSPSLTSTVCGLNTGLLNVGTITGNGPFTYTVNGIPPQTSPTFVGLAGGIYHYSVTDANGCSSIDSAWIGTIINTVASFTPAPPDGTVPLNVDFINNSSNANSYLWNLGNGSTSTSQNPFTTYTEVGSYTVSLIAYNNLPQCADTAWYTIVVYPEAQLVIPNIFTPNGDNVNDVFKVSGTGVSKVEATIYDRWGKKVGSWIGDLNQGWSGADAPDGTYFYTIIATALSGDQKEYSGFVQLIH